MATKQKANHTTPSGDRRSGSTSPASVTKRPTKPTTADNKRSSTTSNSSSPTSKPLPNYLRSTASSSHHLASSTKSTTLVKKNHDSENQASKSPKPTPNRRTSFDKPPSPSGLRKSLNSPGKEAKDAERKSKSQSVKSLSSAQKPASKSVSVTKPMVWQAKTSSGTGLRRSSSGIPCGSSKKDGRGSSSTSVIGGSKAPRSRDITEILNLEANLEALNRHEVGEVDEIESIVEDDCGDLPDPEHNVDDQHKAHASDSVPDVPSVTDAAEESEANVNAENETVIQEQKELDDQHDQVEEADPKAMALIKIRS